LFIDKHSFYEQLKKGYLEDSTEENSKEKAEKPAPVFP